MGEDENKDHHHHYSHHHHESQSDQQPPPPQYGTSQGVANYPPPHHSHHHHESQSDQQPPPPPQYGTFQGVANYPPPLPPRPPQQPSAGFPRPVPPPGANDSTPPNPQYYAHGYQTVPGYAVAEGRPVREPRLPCCGIGCAWFLFIIGFFLAGIPWYIGAIILLCSRVDHREKPGYIACVLAAVLATVAIVFGAVKISDD